MENNENLQQRIKELEEILFFKESEIDELVLANSKLGYSTRLMSEFHLTQDDKEKIADLIDSSKNTSEVKEVYDKIYKKFFNKTLVEDLSEFQMSKSFKDNLIEYLSVSVGYDPILTIGENIQIISDYFSLENKIRSTPDAGPRQILTDKLLSDRPNSIESINKIIDIVNSFNLKN